MTHLQYCILKYCIAQERTFSDIIARFQIPDDDTRFNEIVFGKTRLSDFYTITYDSMENWGNNKVRASDKGISYAEERKRDNIRWIIATCISAATLILSATSVILQCRG